MRQFVGRLFWLVPLAGCLVSAGCDLDGSRPPRIEQQPGVAGAEAPGSPSPREQPLGHRSALPQPPDALPQPPDVGKGPDTISIASFNIQVFGTSKLGKPEVMDVLARVVRRFDIVAVQEIRAADQTVVPRFIELINADGSRFDFVLSERLGRTSSKEQYAYLYDTRRIELVPHSAYTIPDPDDRLHRPPLVASFRVRDSSVPRPFTFTLVNIHTDPDEVRDELNALDDVFVAVQRAPLGEDDVILLGDLNANEYRLGELGGLPGIVCAIRGVPTNTRGTKTYDNIVFDGRATVEYTGRSGVVDLMGEYGLTLEQALAVSDHLPVWAVFSKHEGRGGPLAGEPQSTATR